MQRKFIDREDELQLLEQRWRSERAELVIVYGRRRIGKTFVLRHFAESVPTVYYPAARLPEAQQLAELGVLFGRHLDDPVLEENGFASWDQLLGVLARLQHRLLLVLDEYPYLVESQPGLSSMMQRAWDHQLADRDLMIVLCGSSVAMMEQEALNVTSPLYGRRTGSLRLDPMDPMEAAGFVPGWSDDDLVRAYAAFGGVPHYLAQIDPRRCVAENLLDLVIRRGAPFRDEVEYLLRQELTQARVYYGILAAIAAGRRKMAEIANATGLVPTSLSRYLGVLQSLGLVEREVPATEHRPEKSKKGLYRITDPLTAFWFRHVLPNRSLLEAGRTEEASATIMESFERSVPEVYEEICRTLVRRGALDAATGNRWSRVGRWWDRQAEIDVLAFSDQTDRLLVGEAKWSGKKVGLDIVERLESSAQRLPDDLVRRPMTKVLFSRSGFTDRLAELARESNDLLLISGLPRSRECPSPRPGGRPV